MKIRIPQSGTPHPSTSFSTKGSGMKMKAGSESILAALTARRIVERSSQASGASRRYRKESGEEQATAAASILSAYQSQQEITLSQGGFEICSARRQPNVRDAVSRMLSCTAAVIGTDDTERRHPSPLEYALQCPGAPHR